MWCCKIILELKENFLSSSCQPNYEEETNGLAIDAENRDLDSEFEDSESDVRAQTEVKDEAQSLRHIPKCMPTILSVKNSWKYITSLKPEISYRKAPGTTKTAIQRRT